MDSLPRSNLHLLVCSPAAETSQGAGPVQARYRWLLEVGRTQDLPGSWGIHPLPLPRSPIPAGPTPPHPNGRVSGAPRSPN